ncbi:T9SS type A sorting domain-containing protein [Flavobacterium sp.]|uniref:Ig-like domain-containing protein n=1 Tax=Flavobacterium sp. TaxID=239 RepID=UPI003BD799A7
MKKNLLNRKSTFLLFFCFLFVLLISNNARGQQVLGSFPYMDGGFEGQTATLTGATIPGSLSATSWSVSPSSTSTTKLMINNPALARTGNKYASHATSVTTARLQSPTSANVINAPTVSTQYTVQYYYKTTTDQTTSLQGSIYNDNTSGVPNNSKSSLVMSTYQSGIWTKATVTLTTNTAAVVSSTNFAGVRYLLATSSTVNIDDFVVYAGAVDTTLPDSSTTGTVANLTASALTLGWTAPATGVDGGGYMVVRYNSNPNVDNLPNANGIYSVGNTITNGTGALQGTVVYIGTATSFNDSLLTSGSTCYYKVFTVDKAFNYSVENLVAATTLSAPATPIASAATTVNSNGFTANWNSVIGAASYNVYLYEANTTHNIVGWTFPVSWTAAQGVTPVADIANANNTTKVITQSGGTVTAGEGSGGPGTYAMSGTSWYVTVGKNWEIQANTTGYKNIKVSSKLYSTAPRDFKLQYKIGSGGTYADVPNGAIVCSGDWGTGNLYNLVLPAECENQPSVYLRWINYTSLDYTTGTALIGGSVRIDDILVTGNLYQAVAGYPINVATNSATITGLNSGSIYYYEVNASNGSANSLNSNQITATTKISQDLADYRTTTSGDFSDSLIWEWNDGSGVWAAATQAPSSTNNIFIISGHTVTMSADFTVGANKALMVNGTLNLAGKNISGGGNFIVSAGASIKLGENTSLATAVTTSSYAYNSSANYFFDGLITAQSTTLVPSNLLGNITISNPAGVKLSQSLKAYLSSSLLVTSSGKLSFGDGVISTTNFSGTGNFTAQSGSTLVVTSADGLNSGSLLGNIRNSGTRIFSNGVNYNFTKNDLISVVNMGTAFTIVAPATTPEITSIKDLTVNNTLNVIVPANIKIDGVLTFVSGNIETGNNNITMGTAGSILGAGTGWVVGNLIKQTAPGNNPTFSYAIGDETNYTPVALTFTTNNSAVNTGSIAASSSSGDHPSISNSGLDDTKSVNRTWTITNNGITGFTNYDASFTYSISDNDSGANPANYATRNYENATWNATSLSGIPTNTNINLTGITSFGDFAVAETTGLPEIPTQPINSSICNGSNTSFTVAITTTLPSTLKWQRRTNNGNSWEDITSNLDSATVYEGFTTDTLTLTGSDSTINSYQYRAVCTTINGSANSNVASLTVVTTIAPSSSDQEFCISGTVAALTAVGTELNWYSEEANGSPLVPTDELSTGTYYVSQTENSCESVRTSIFVTVNPQPFQPTLACYETASFNSNTCSWDVSGAVPEQPILACYETASFNSETCSWEVSGVVPEQPILACYETASFNPETCLWDVTGTPVLAPTGATTQSFNSNQTIADIVVVGNNIVWYSSSAEALSNSNPLASTTLLVSGTTYYAMQTVNGCFSASPLAVTVTINLSNSNFDMVGLEYFPNPVINNLNLLYTQAIDSITIYNIIGQQIKFLEPNSPSTLIDMNTFPEGNYILQIESNGKNKVIKISKKTN